MTVSEALAPGEELRYRARPAGRSFWVFFLGILLLGVAPFFRENPPISPTTGLLFAGIFALLIARRWTEVYTVTNRRIMIRAGLFGRESSEVPLSDVTGVESFTGFNLRLVGAAHILVRSRRPDQENIMMYGQLNPKKVRETLESLAAEAGGLPGREDDGEG